jgi:hypothetical protein
LFKIGERRLIKTSDFMKGQIKSKKLKFAKWVICTIFIFPFSLCILAQSSAIVPELCSKINQISKKLQKDIYPEWNEYLSASIKCKADTLVIEKTTYGFDQSKVMSKSQMDTLNHFTSIYKLPLKKIILEESYDKYHQLWFRDRNYKNTILFGLYDFKKSELSNDYTPVSDVNIKFDIGALFGISVWNQEELDLIVLLGNNINELIDYYSK